MTVGMNKKLTLSMDGKVIERAKVYAKSHNTSVSQLLESYLQTLIAAQDGSPEITPLVASLSGVIQVPEDVDILKEYGNHLDQKYK